jgi:GNAT superfamily N-acetyltransferase
MKIDSAVQIIEGDLNAALQVSQHIPEFDHPYDEAEYLRRLKGVKHLILTAQVEQNAVAFKVGYDRFRDGSFYSWMGGVDPNYRRKGLATALADYQEEWAIRQGFRCVRIKTYHQHNHMLQFAQERGFRIVRIIPNKVESETILWLQKELVKSSD